MTPAPENRAALVDDMLLDAGCQLDADLRNALLSLGTLASLPAPAPSGELAALLTAGGPSPLEGPAPAGEPAGEPGEEAAEEAPEQPGGQPDAQPGDELARRRRRRHRPTALGLVLVAGMGLGVGGVAASSSTSGTSPVEHLLEDWAPWNGTAGEPSAAGYSYRGPQVASDGDLAAAGSPAPGGAADAANLASSLLRDPAGSSRHTGRAHSGFPPCVGPVKHEAGAEACTPAAPGTSLQGDGLGRGKENPGAATDGMPAGQGASGPAKAGLPAASTGPSAGDAAAEAQKAAGSAANAMPGQGQTGSQAAGQGAGPKPTSPAK